MRNQTGNNSHRKDIWFRAESRTYILFLCLILGCIAFLTLAEGTNAHIIFVKICVYFSVFFGTIIIVSQFKSVIIPASYIDPKDKAVFVTGCASGFGKELVKKLDSLGFKVFAAVRSIEGDDRVQDLLSCCSKRVTMVKMDVTNNNEVLAAASFVKKKLGSSCLWAVVCNAGLYSCQGFDWGSEGISEYERIMNANTFGSVRVVKAFVPLLKETQDSRIVINSSISSEYHCDKSSTSNLYQLCYFSCQAPSHVQSWPHIQCPNMLLRLFLILFDWNSNRLESLSLKFSLSITLLLLLRRKRPGNNLSLFGLKLLKK